MRATELRDAPLAAPHFSAARQVAVSALWFTWFAQWVTIPSILVPNQVKAMLGGHAAWLEFTTGAVVAGGAMMASLIAPLAGALSDRTPSPRGRRRPFLIQGVLASSAALAILGLSARGGNLLLYGLAYLHLQFWWNWAAGPYAGMIPDVVPKERQGMASGWMNVLGILGLIAGNALMLIFYRPNRAAPIIAIFIALNILCLLATLIGASEPPFRAALPRRRFAAFIRSFYLRPSEHPDFYLVLATRLFSNLGIWSVLAFLLFYMESILGLTETAASKLLPALLLAGGCLAIPASLFGIRIAARYGLVFFVQLSSWTMAAATLCYVLIALAPAVTLIVPVVIVFSIANGAYGAADWYLALRVLPSTADTGKDFGIWHVCMVLPQIIGPVTTGLLITAVKSAASARFAYALAFAIAAFWFILAAALVGRVRLAEHSLTAS